MRKLIGVLVLMLAMSSVFAQAPVGKGKAQLNAGFGFSSWGLPVYVGFDYGIHPDFTLGLEAGYRSYSEKWDKYSYRHSIMSIAGTANYHFNRVLSMPSEWNFYAGLNVGFYVWSGADDTYKGSHTSGLGLGGQVGGRYFFNSNFGLNLEMGAGYVSGGKIGITYKF